MTDITDLNATELSRAIQARKIGCAEVMQAYLQQWSRLNPRHNALVNLRPEQTLLEEAREADK